jgi:hypothetical protein
MSICAAHCSWVCCSKSTRRMTSYSSSVSRIGLVFSHPLGQKVSICGAPQIRRHRGGLGMDDFLLLFSVYTDYNISRRKINTDFLKAAVMLISELCVGCMSFGKAGTMHDWTLDETEKVVKHALETLSSSPRCGRH